MDRPVLMKMFALALALACAFAPAASNAADFSGNATLTSDYVWRGSTQTHGDPAVQAGLKVAGASGLYATAWGTNVEFAPDTHARSELDFTVGWSKALSGDWALDINLLRYQYPSTTIDLNWTELNSTLTWKNTYWASVGWSDEALGYDASGTYALVGAKLPVSETFRFETALAHYFLDDAVVAEDGYTHGAISAVWAFHAPFELRLTAHGTDSNARRIFGDAFAGSRIEAALQATF
ncbi:TorF family putative porin [Lysobacter sp. 2RAF19]